MARRPSQEEEGSGYSWMDTYGDMVTLLLCFFVLLYSFSSIDAQKWQELVAAFAGEYSGSAISVIGMSETAGGRADVLEPPIRAGDLKNRRKKGTASDSGESWMEDEKGGDKLYENIRRYIEINDMQGSVNVYRTEEAIYLRFNEMALFSSGRAEILPANEENLNNIMEIIYAHKSDIRAIRIEGHTDDVPIHTAEFRDNWDLSAKRATNVLRLVLTYGYFEEDMLSAVGYGEFQPAASNETAEGRAENRRVDFVLIRADYPEGGRQEESGAEAP